ncbi:MAG: hypothetical protein OER77_12715 [Myxococcales bacterium]|nr:hypothetical protein [Myxococcales bacterium]
MIEHAGAISGLIDARAGTTGRILIRPPIGQRANFGVNTTLSIDNALIAGYGGGEVSLTVDGSYQADADNSGFAWIESDASDGAGYFGVGCNGGGQADAFFYEIVFKRYADISFDSDRGGIRGGWPVGSGGTCDMELVGSWIAGVTCPDGGDHPQGIDCHSDTFQEYCPECDCDILLKDSIMWGSEDKVVQGSSYPDCGFPFIMENVTFISPQYALPIWTGPSFFWWGSGPQPFHTTAWTHFSDSTLIGSCYPNPGELDIRANDSELYEAEDCLQDPASSGNTILRSLPPVPSAPTHTELDAIWSP